MFSLYAVSQVFRKNIKSLRWNLSSANYSAHIILLFIFVLKIVFAAIVAAVITYHFSFALTADKNRFSPCGDY